MIWFQRKGAAETEWSQRGWNNKPGWRRFQNWKLFLNYVFRFRLQHHLNPSDPSLPFLQPLGRRRDCGLVLLLLDKMKFKQLGLKVFKRRLTWAPYTYLSSIFPPSVWPPMSHTCRVTFKFPATKRNNGTMRSWEWKGFSKKCFYQNWIIQSSKWFEILKQQKRLLQDVVFDFRLYSFSITNLFVLYETHKAEKVRSQQ